MDIDKVVGNCPVYQMGELLQAVWNATPSEQQQKFIEENSGEISTMMPETE